MTTNLRAATCRSVAEWAAAVDAAQLDGSSAIIAWLKCEYGLDTSTQAW